MVKVTDPIKIRNMEIKNRLGFPPMMSGSISNGVPGKNFYNVYEPIARGGAGLITVEATGTEPMNNPIQPSMGLDENIPAFKKFTDKIHEYNTKIGIQFAHGGILSLMMIAIMKFPMPVWAPSSVDPVVASSAYDLILPNWREDLAKTGFKGIHEITPEEMDGVGNRFAAAAKRAIDSGFDYIEIHSAHGTLFHDFLSPYYNQRTDEYGGSWENKTRFAKETIQKIRDKIGDNPIFIRISAEELLDNGLKVEDQKKVAVLYEKAGVDCIDVSQGIQVRTPEGINIPTYIPPGGFIHYAEAIKKVVNIPVIGVGNIIEMKMANDFIEQGKADIIYMGRQLIVDPETPNKYFNGLVEDTKYCIGCQVGCGGVCVLNPYERHNYKELVPTEDPKKIAVIGGGIAGMELARVAKLRGHNVELYEKSDKLGGLMHILAAEYKKEQYMNVAKYQQVQLKKLAVPIHLNKELSNEEIKALDCDVLVFAVGTKAVVPVKFEGHNNVITQDEAILKSKPIGKNVVIWGLDTYWKGGAETAITLREQGHNIKAIAGSEAVLAGILTQARLTGRVTWIHNYFKNNEIPQFKKAKLLEVTDKAVIIKDAEGNEHEIEADTLVHIGGRVTPKNTLEKEFENVGFKVEFIGDCKKPRDIQGAIHDAQTLARAI
jgi:2,4-dienoyl-CoA reductase-like NADH-dependent reductase (Old Yellow Enzyme family)/pyruvate/2-oxoglutarate dehydrogenase complex dihydrolipoamide dehydrogenase (E3) component